MSGDGRGAGAAITAVGVCTSLGDAITACAAARAGLSRPTSLEYVVRSDATGEPEALRGYPVPSAAGFVGRARLVVLGEQALGDLLRYEPVHQAGARCGFHLCMTDADTRRWLPDEPLDRQAAREQQRGDIRAREEVAEQLADLAGLKVEAAARRVFASGPAGLAAAVQHAMAAFRTGELDACIVGGVDSLVELSALRFLHEAGRLRTPDDATGLFPGEAAAFLLLERPDRARREGRAALAQVAAAADEEGEDPDLVERPPRGTALLSLLSRLAEGTRAAPGPCWALTDQNGETFRAAEWGDFVVRASGPFPRFEVRDHWYPAISFGDTGAASGALAACLATRAFVRGYAPAPTALVVSSTYEGLRGALCVERASGRP